MFFEKKVQCLRRSTFLKAPATMTDDHHRDLDAARGGTAVAAYEHQYLHKQNTAVRKLRKSDGVEARRPRRDRLEEADVKTFAGALSFQHAAAVFERKEQQCGHEPQQKRRPQRYAGVQTVLPVNLYLPFSGNRRRCIGRWKFVL